MFTIYVNDIHDKLNSYMNLLTDNAKIINNLLVLTSEKIAERFG